MSLFKSYIDKERERREAAEAYAARQRELKPLTDMQVLLLAVAEIYQDAPGCCDEALMDALYDRAGTDWTTTTSPE